MNGVDEYILMPGESVTVFLPLDGTQLCEGRKKRCKHDIDPLSLRCRLCGLTPAIFARFPIKTRKRKS